MAYTIIEVEKKTGMPSRTLRFYLNKGLFPFIERDENGVRYFSEKDIEWVHWIHCYRKCGMSIKEIRDYIQLCKQGEATITERLEIITKQKAKVLESIEKLQSTLPTLDFKIEYYKQMLDKRKDSLNPLSKDYDNPCATRRVRIKKNEQIH